MDIFQPIDNSSAHAAYRMRPQPDLDSTDLLELHKHIGALNEELASAYLVISGVPAEWHDSTCAINQAPAYRPGPCDCGADKRGRRLTR